MKKLTIITVSLATSIAILLGTNQTVLAVPIKSDSKISVVKNDEATENPPLEPGVEEPDEPTGEKGDLTIDLVSHLDFGQMKLDSKTQTLKANQTRQQKYVVKTQVTDKRGQGSGWTLSVAQTKTLTNEHSQELKGAAITFPEAELSTGNPTLEAAPLAKGIVLTSTPQPIMIAAKDSGMGSWLSGFTKENAPSLKVPSGNYVGSYQGELTWSLIDAPK